MPRSRSFTWTLNNPTPDDEPRLRALVYKYIIWGREVAPTTGTPHLQGMIMWSNAKNISQARAVLPGCHVEITKDSYKSMLYCRKDGDFEEHGQSPKTPACGGDMEKNRYKRVRELAAAGDMDTIGDEAPDIYIRHYATLKKIKEEHQVKPAAMTDLDFHWYVGPTGSGKSRKAHTENPDAYLKLVNKWWDGYQPGQTVIIDEWDPEASKFLASHLKRWADHHPFSAEVKGGTRVLRPPKLIVTSNYTIEECFTEARDREPLMRRFTQVRFGASDYHEKPFDAGTYFGGEFSR